MQRYEAGDRVRVKAVQGGEEAVFEARVAVLATGFGSPLPGIINIAVLFLIAGLLSILTELDRTQWLEREDIEESILEQIFSRFCVGK